MIIMVFIANVVTRIIYSCAFYKILISDESLAYIQDNSATRDFTIVNK